MTVQDWLNKWNDSHNDVQNMLNLLQEYVRDTNIPNTPSILDSTTTPIQNNSFFSMMTSWMPSNTQPGISVNVSNNARIADVSKAILLIEQLNSNNNGSQTVYNIPIEYVLACVKQEIHNYQGFTTSMAVTTLIQLRQV